MTYEPRRNSAGSARSRHYQPTITERTERAFLAYLDLLDTAVWIRSSVEGQLARFDLNVEQFRLLEMLWRNGPMTMSAIVEKRWYRRQSLFGVTDRLAERGWVARELARMAATEIDVNRLRKEQRGKERRGRLAATIRLTAEGAKFVAVVRRRHSKLVYAFMRAIDAREVDTLSRACKRLREGDIMKLLNEIMTEDLD